MEDEGMRIVDDVLELSDGRRLGYRVRGPAAGAPILYFHGQPASRLEADLIPEAVLRRHEARLISFDRPGMGRSDLLPARDMVDDLPDAVALLDHLGLDVVGVIGTSAGGPWALAFAAAHPARVRSVGLMCASGPYDDDRYLSDEDIEEHRELRDRGAHSMVAEYEAARDRMMADMKTALGSWFEEFPDAEQQWAASEPALSILATEAREALRQGARGWLRGTEIRFMPWSFHVASIRAPVHAFHGTDDAWELVSNIQRIVDAIPDARLTLIPGGNHLAPVMRSEDVVAAVVG
jgi:pimeloyl-ACP methyl ester carboxylesterase